MKATAARWLWWLCASALACTEPSAPDPILDAGPTPAATLTRTEGPVHLQRDGQTQPAATGPLFVEDTIETGPDGSAEVRFPGGRLVRLSPDSRLTVDEDAEGLVLSIHRGQLKAQSDGPSVALRILTPFGLTRLGTQAAEVAMTVKGSEANVEVQVGQVELLTRNGNRVVAQAGQVVLLSRGQEPVVQVDAGVPVRLEPLEVVVRPDGKAQVKPTGAKRWSAVGKTGARLSEGDAVRIVQGEGGIAVGDQALLTLQKGGELRLGEVDRTPAGDAVGLSLAAGGFHASFGAAPLRLSFPELELHSTSGGGQLTARRDGETLEVKALTGAFQLSAAGGTGGVSAGSTARVHQGQLKVEADTQAALVLPSSRGLRVFHPGLTEASLSWPDPGKPVRLKVGRESSLSKPFLDGPLSRAWLNVPIPRRGALYWKVESEAGEPIAQGSAWFAPESAPSAQTQLTNRVPESAPRTTIYYQNRPPAVTFTFHPQPGAARYRLRVYAASALHVPVAERESRGNFATLEEGVLKEGSYWWSATPINPQGGEMRGGRMAQLDIVYDNALPSLVIRSPANGAPASRSVLAAGTAPVGSRLRVNGRTVTLDEKARFSVPVSPLGRPPLVVFSLSGPHGADQLTVRRLGLP